jgi:prevent-host-death family protein
MWYHIKTGGDIMNISSDIKPVSFLKSHAADILKQINDTHRPIDITQNGEPKGVLQDPESYDNMRRAIGLLKLILQGEEDIKQGNTKTQSKVFKDIDKILAKKEK